MREMSGLAEARRAMRGRAELLWRGVCVFAVCCNSCAPGTRARTRRCGARAQLTAQVAGGLLDARVGRRGGGAEGDARARGTFFELCVCCCKRLPRAGAGGRAAPGAIWGHARGLGLQACPHARRPAAWNAPSDGGVQDSQTRSRRVPGRTRLHVPSPRNGWDTLDRERAGMTRGVITVKHGVDTHASHRRRTVTCRTVVQSYTRVTQSHVVPSYSHIHVSTVTCKSRKGC